MVKAPILGVLAAVMSVLAAAACESSAPARGNAPAGYGAALRAVVDPSRERGGTIIFDDAGTPDSTDPGNTYSGPVSNIVRLYGRSLLTYRSAPGAAGSQLVPDLATGLGRVSDHGPRWTYHLKPGIRFEDDGTVTSQDVKYAVERSYARDVLPGGPDYFQMLLQDLGYRGPYKDTTPDRLGLTSVQTPDPATIVFRLRRPFADFDYVAALPQTMPVPPARDTGSHYQLHPASTGPYMFRDYQPDKQFTLVPNPYWDPATDPNRKQLAARLVFNLNINATTIDENLIHDFAQVDVTGAGINAAAQAQILQNPALKKNADDVPTGGLAFTYINTKVKPLDNVHCRRAIEYAADKTAFQTARGGPLGGDVATTVLPPGLAGYDKFDLYGTAARPHGDLARARQELAGLRPAGRLYHRHGLCRQRAQGDIGGRRRAAGAVPCREQGHSPGLPVRTYYADFAGVPSYVHQHDLGLAIGGWGADWPDGYGFLYNLVAGPAIAPAANPNISELDDPVVNNMFTTALATASTTARTRIWSRIDRQVMSDAAILPGVYEKLLLYRNPHLTNVYVNRYYAMYDVASLGIK